MARYFYAWIPFGGLSVVLLLMVPFLGPIVALALVAGAVAALGALVWRLVAAIAAFVGLVLRRRPHVRSMRTRTAAVAVQAQTAPTLEYYRS